MYGLKEIKRMNQEAAQAEETTYQAMIKLRKQIELHLLKHQIKIDGKISGVKIA